MVVLTLICGWRLILESSRVHTSRSFLLPTKKTEEPASCKDLRLNSPCWETKPSSPLHMGIKTSGPRTWRLAPSWGNCHVTWVLTTLLLYSLLSLRICGFLFSYQLSHALKRLATIYLPLNVHIRMVFKLCNPKYYQNLPAMTYSLLFHAFLHVFPQPRIHSLLSCQENCIPSSRSSSSITSTINHLFTTSSCFPSLKSFPLSM